MLKNYFIVAIRNLKRSKIFSFINITGLALGLAISSMILMYVVNELTYDRFNENYENIYRVTMDLEAMGNKISGPITMAPLAPYLNEEYPDIKHAARMSQENHPIITYDNKLYEQTGLYYADPELFDIFTIKFLKGDPETCFENPFSVIITEETAKKYFGDENPIGKVFTFNNSNEYTVTGVVEEMSSNSHLSFEMLASFSTMYKLRGEEMMNIWLMNSYTTYVELQDGITPDDIAPKFREIIKEKAESHPIAIQYGMKAELLLQPLKDIHLHSHFTFDDDNSGDTAFIYIYSAVALFILLIACINFMNLSTARSASRAREVGMRKVIGAERSRLIRQFLGESIFMSLLGLIIALVLIEFLLPVFNTLINVKLTYSIVKNWQISFGLLGISLVVGCVAGIYPAFFLSSFKPVKVLKGTLKAGSGNRIFRDVLVVFQFVISIALIICTFTMLHQISYMKNKPLGFNKDHILIVPLRGSDIRSNMDVFKANVLAIEGVQSASLSSNYPGDTGDMEYLFSFEGLEDQQPMIMKYEEVDYDYFNTLGIEFVEGRNFSEDMQTDDEAFIVNQALVTQLGYDQPIGKEVYWSTVEDPNAGLDENTMVDLTYKIIGVINNYHFESLHDMIRPVLIHLGGSEMNELVVKVRPENMSKTISAIEKEWGSLSPNRPFTYHFLDDRIAQQYIREQRQSKTIIYVTFIAVLIACLGLFGLSTFIAEQRRKEVGIRKVLGATVGNITLKLSRELTQWTLIANVIAWPVAYFAMSKWLQGFAYRAPINIGLFILAGVSAIAVALLTISFYTIRAAHTNPAEVIKYE
ncbi:MAG: ABC transporter permease [Candidatus Cloacimonetes bacterium]|nr:ABC transporter permease [Candidatus Cloacimonadota bacterium]